MQQKKIDGKELIKFDDATHAYLSNLEHEFNRLGYEKGDPILALTTMPGLVYWLEGYLPGSASYMINDKFNCHYIQRLSFENGRMPLVIHRLPLSDEMKKCLNNSSLQFDKKYHLAATIKSAYSNNHSYFEDSDQFPYLYIYTATSKE